MRILPFAAADEQAVVALLRAGADAHSFLSDKSREDYFGRMKAELRTSEVFVAQDEDTRQIIGCIMLINCCIAGVFVDPEKQRQSIGRLLVEHARSQRRKSLWAEVYTKNTKAQSFFKRCGFYAGKQPAQDKNTDAMITMTQEKPETTAVVKQKESVGAMVADGVGNGIAEGVVEGALTALDALLSFGD